VKRSWTAVGAGAAWFVAAIAAQPADPPSHPPANPPAAAQATVSDPIEAEYRRLLEADDAAHAAVDQWIRENAAFSEQGADYSHVTLNARIERRLEPVEKAYRDFLLRNPGHARARLAYGSFLNGLGRDDEARVQWERVRDQDPKNPAVWNNLADYHARNGPIRKAFECLDRALALKPEEPVYCRNLATLLLLQRAEAREAYRLEDDQAVLRRALDLYRKARRFDPDNFTLAADLAQVYYHLSSTPAGDKAAEARLADEALAAWGDALRLARNDLDREGVRLHLARVCLRHGRVEEARKHLGSVQNPALGPAKQQLAEELERRPGSGPK